jgi:nitrous oxidase accessory protein
MYSERNALIGNRFSNCTGGIALMFSMRNRIEANEAVDNDQFGILCQQLEHSHVEGNRLTGNGRGFYVENSAGNQFVNNHLVANGVGVYLTAGSEANLFTANRFVGNLVQVFEDREGANAFFDEGRGNFWSDYAGFDWNGDGVGETPYRLRSAAAALMARRPTTRWFWMSPVLALLDWWDAQMTSSEVGSFDPFPLVGPLVGPQVGAVTNPSSEEAP